MGREKQDGFRFLAQRPPRQQRKTAWQRETIIITVHVKRCKPDLRGTKNSNGTKVFLLCLEVRKASKVLETQCQIQARVSGQLGGLRSFLLVEPKGHMLRRNSRESSGLEKLEGDFPSRKK